MKRLIDILAVLVILPLAIPLLLVTALAVRLNLGSPVLFKQLRPGRGGEPFQLIKFRTMRDAHDAAGNPLPDADRLTGFGRFLRASSLDELPELWNILKGEMTLVGPRPLLMDYLELYSPRQARRHEVAPGLTGWAQINGRNALSWDEKFELDVWYVDNQNLMLDLKILWMTLAKVVMREGISQTGDATMPRFDPNQSGSDQSGPEAEGPGIGGPGIEGNTPSAKTEPPKSA